MKLKYIIGNLGIFTHYSNFDFNLTIPFNITYNNVFTLANMSQLAYDMEDNSLPVDNSTIKAFLFTNDDNSVNVISIKGTTPGFLINYNENTDKLIFQDLDKDKRDIDREIIDKFSEISKNDKLNDNLFFSCCFYKESNLFKDHCNINIDQNNFCSNKCYKNSTYIENNYYVLSLNIINKLSEIIDFENSTIIFTGHSLGGAIATYLGITYNKTVVTFETPGEKHYLQQLLSKKQLNDLIKNKNLNIYHFGHTADPIVTGECGNTCWIVGYSIYTKCHIGYSCIYDSITKLKMSQFIWRHRLKWVIDYIFPYWISELPECIYHDTILCNECENWTYIN